MSKISGWSSKLSEPFLEGTDLENALSDWARQLPMITTCHRGNGLSKEDFR